MAWKVFIFFFIFSLFNKIISCLKLSINMLFKFYLDDTILKKLSKLFPLPSLTPLGIAIQDVMNVTYSPSFPCRLLPS